MAVSLKAVHPTSGPKIIFLSVKRVWHIYIKNQFIIFQFLIFALLRAKMHFGRTEVADRDQKLKVKFTDLVRRVSH